MRRYSWICVVLLAVLTPAIWAQTSDENLPKLKTKVKTLAAFKNGLGFVYRAGSTDLRDGWTAMEPIPPAALGTLWIGTTSKGRSVDEVVSYRGKETREYEAVNLVELLEANVGKQVFVEYLPQGASQSVRIQGTILSVPKDRAPDEDALVPGTQRQIDRSQGQIVLLQIPGEENPVVKAINKQSIQSMELAEGSTLKTRIEREVNSAKLRISGNPKSAEITLAYLEKGINWSPGYLVNIHDDGKADLTLEAVLANDVEDLEDVDVSFVVGYPNLMYADTITPLAMQQSIASFVQGLLNPREPSRGPGGPGGIMSQSIAYNVSGYQREQWNPESTYSSTSAMPGETNEDLYFYHQDHVTLKKGSRARYTVFSEKVPYEHIYLWEIPDSMNVDNGGYRSESRRPNQGDDDLYLVWHALRLQNNTKQPWTTAPAFTVNGSMPVAQDVLKYTPSGGKNTLKLTVATEVRANQDQIEVSRKHTELLGYRFDEVVVEVKLSIKNWKQIPIRANVQKSLIGEVLSVDQGGKVRKVVKKLNFVNPTSEIEWEFDLAPGQETVLTSQYKVYVHL